MVSKVSRQTALNAPGRCQPLLDGAGHVLRRSKEGEVMSIELDSTWEGRRYFVPSSEQVSGRGESGNIPACSLPAEAAGIRVDWHVQLYPSSIYIAYIARLLGRASDE